ncbi:DUF1273 domain-containing protein [Bacillus massiliigorillae]|uniref:DUF1273 domain-containing protein n=1 Tax=Bacillus massiliigorillae TaxID=1243664 RepID=UPI000399A579|nr:DUF1273 domain-containing protein [Bacillus massiliigorillae]
MLKVLFVTGYKNFELGIFNNNSNEANFIKKAIEKRLLQLVEEGLEWVIITGQLGVELWAGEAVINIRKEYPELHLAVTPPFLEQESNWNEKNQEYYHYILSQADFVEAISKQKYVNPMQFKNRDQFLLAKSDGLLIVYDEEQEGSVKYFYNESKRYQEKHDYQIMQMDFYELQQYIEAASMDYLND